MGKYDGKRMAHRKKNRFGMSWVCATIPALQVTGNVTLNYMLYLHEF